MVLGFFTIEAAGSEDPAIQQTTLTITSRFTMDSCRNIKVTADVIESTLQQALQRGDELWRGVCGPGCQFMKARITAGCDVERSQGKSDDGGDEKDNVITVEAILHNVP